MASAIAFGGVFARRGMALGTARITYRVWQVYWAHIGMFMAVFLVVTLLTWSDIGTRNYAHQLALHPFLRDPSTQIVGPRVASSTLGRLTSDPPRRSTEQGGLRATTLNPGAPGIHGQPLPPVSSGVGIAMPTPPFFR